MEGLLFGPIPALESNSEFILRWLYATPEPTEPVNAFNPTKYITVRSALEGLNPQRDGVRCSIP